MIHLVALKAFGLWAADICLRISNNPKLGAMGRVSGPVDYADFQAFCHLGIGRSLMLPSECYVHLLVILCLWMLSGCSRAEQEVHYSTFNLIMQICVNSSRAAPTSQQSQRMSTEANFSILLSLLQEAMQNKKLSICIVRRTVEQKKTNNSRSNLLVTNRNAAYHEKENNDTATIFRKQKKKMKSRRWGGGRREDENLIFNYL